MIWLISKESKPVLNDFGHFGFPVEPTAAAVAVVVVLILMYDREGGRVGGEGRVIFIDGLTDHWIMHFHMISISSQWAEGDAKRQLSVEREASQMRIGPPFFFLNFWNINTHSSGSSLPNESANFALHRRVRNNFRFFGLRSTKSLRTFLLGSTRRHIFLLPTISRRGCCCCCCCGRRVYEDGADKNEFRFISLLQRKDEEAKWTEEDAHQKAGKKEQQQQKKMNMFRKSKNLVIVSQWVNYSLNPAIRIFTTAAGLLIIQLAMCAHTQPFFLSLIHLTVKHF